MSNLEESSARRKESRQYGTNVFAKQSLAGTNYSADKMQLFVSFGVPPALRNEPRSLEEWRPKCDPPDELVIARNRREVFHCI